MKSIPCGRLKAACAGRSSGRDCCETPARGMEKAAPQRVPPLREDAVHAADHILSAVFFQGDLPVQADLLAVYAGVHQQFRRFGGNFGGDVADTALQPLF